MAARYATCVVSGCTGIRVGYHAVCVAHGDAPVLDAWFDEATTGRIDLRGVAVDAGLVALLRAAADRPGLHRELRLDDATLTAELSLQVGPALVAINATGLVANKPIRLTGRLSTLVLDHAETPALMLENVRIGTLSLREARIGHIEVAGEVGRLDTDGLSCGDFRSDDLRRPSPWRPPEAAPDVADDGGVTAWRTDLIERLGEYASVRWLVVEEWVGYRTTEDERDEVVRVGGVLGLRSSRWPVVGAEGRLAIFGPEIEIAVDADAFALALRRNMDEPVGVGSVLAVRATAALLEREDRDEEDESHSLALGHEAVDALFDGPMLPVTREANEAAQAAMLAALAPVVDAESRPGRGLDARDRDRPE